MTLKRFIAGAALAGGFGAAALGLGAPMASAQPPFPGPGGPGPGHGWVQQPNRPDVPGRTNRVTTGRCATTGHSSTRGNG